MIRDARPDEADALTALVLRSKASWGYDDEFMRMCAPELIITSEMIRARSFFVAEDANRVLGVAGLGDFDPESGEIELEFLFVEPDVLGRGVGTALFEHAEVVAKSRHARSMVIHGDPFAEPFYRARGAVAVGTVPSGTIPGRRLPLFRRELSLRPTESNA